MKLKGPSRSEIDRRIKSKSKYTHRYCSTDDLDKQIENDSEWQKYNKRENLFYIIFLSLWIILGMITIMYAHLNDKI